jgi:hypothetical protein
VLSGLSLYVAQILEETTHPAFAQRALMGGAPIAIGYAATAVAALAVALRFGSWI